MKSPKRPGAPSRRVWAFRFFGIIAIPLLLLALAEGALRLAGFGYPVSYFVPLPEGPAGRFIENQKFGWRFFPQQLARAPEPTVLSKDKAPGAYRIFIFGESAAQGDPVPAYGFGRVLEVLLRERFPGTRFEVVNVAMTAINSHVIRSIASDCANFNGDFWLIYMGNNEVIGPFGAGGVFGTRAPGRTRISASLVAKSTRLGQSLDTFQQRFRGPREWTGLELMQDQVLEANAPELQQVYSNFEANLRVILEIALRANTPVILSTVAVNLRDFPPFGSGGQAEAFFRLGQSLSKLGQATEARAAFQRACDLDTRRFRADSRINELIREAAAASTNSVTLLDAAALFAASEQTVFVDHVHFTFDGNYRLAREFADRLAPLLPPSTNGFLDAESCARRLALTDPDRALIHEEILGRNRRPPFANQLNHEERDRDLTARIEKLRSKIKAEGLGASIALYREALSKAGQDEWIIPERFSGVLEMAGQLPEAATHLEKVVTVVPQNAGAHFKLANIYDRLGKSAKAEQSFRIALRLRPDSAEAMNGLGLALAGQEKFEAAARQFQRALELKPKMAAARVNWGSMLARQKSFAEAEEHFRTALQLDPASAAAILALGELLIARERLPEALAVFSAGTATLTNHAMIRQHFGDALARAGNDEEAIRQYSQAAEIDPNSLDIQMNLGVALARRGDTARASQAFGQAAKVQPNSADAHLYFGITLAQQKRFDDAIREFEWALRLDPTNARAKHYLETASAARQPAVR